MVDVSVLTPSYNYGRFIEDALLSVLRQRDLPVQHVVQDGGSLDETVDSISHYQGDIDWSSEPDKGQSHALNKALSRATGRWIPWLNADDFYLPGSLSHLVRVGERSKADVVYGDRVIVDEGGRLLRLQPSHRLSARVLKEYGCYIPSSSTIFRRSALSEAPWDEDAIRIMNWDLRMNLAEDGARFVNTRRPIGAFRIHEQQVSGGPRDRFARENAIVRERHGLPPDADERWTYSGSPCPGQVASSWSIVHIRGLHWVLSTSA